MTCPTCQSPTRVVSCRSVGDGFIRRRRCENDHRFNTAEVSHLGPFPWAKKTATKPTKPTKRPKRNPKAKPKPSDWLTRINDKLATI
jgi:transcriptional regulator NrdR family protein